MSSNNPHARPLLQVDKLVKRYVSAGGYVHTALDEVSFTLRLGETLGIVGESGCGKSTLARALMRLTPVDAGSVRFDDIDWISDTSAPPSPAHRQRMQMVFQDPYSSLNPKHRVGDIVREPLDINCAELPKAQRLQRVHGLLSTVGLAPSDADKFAHEFSGGQRQRIAIARALALKPHLLVADEPVSALDVSIQSQILNLLMALRSQHEMSMLFISHDLSVIRHISDRVAVMYFGRVVEVASAHEFYNAPSHPYTQLLLSAIPGQRMASKKAASAAQAKADAELPDPHNPPAGCAFAKRCPHAMARCSVEKPALLGSGDHHVACFLSHP